MASGLRLLSQPPHAQRCLSGERIKEIRKDFYIVVIIRRDPFMGGFLMMP